MLQRGFDLPTNDRLSGKVPIISSGGITGYHNATKANPPGVVLGRYGSIGDVYFIETPYWPLNTSLWVKDFCGNDPKFVYYLLCRIDYKKFSDKTGVPGINRNDIHALKVAIPPLPEQKKIAAILSTWDKAIKRIESLIEANEKLKKGLMQQLLTGKRRLPGFDKHSSFRRSHYYDYPNDWEHPRMGEIADDVVRRNGNSKDIAVISCTKYEGFVDSLSYFGKKVFSDDTSNYKLIRHKEFGFPSNHVEEGSIGILLHREVGIVSPIYTVFACNKAVVVPEYLYALLKTDIYRQVFKTSTNASVDRRGSLRWKEFAQIRVPLPDVSEQHAILVIFDTAEKEIKTLRDMYRGFREQKRGLMQKLLTGKLRVGV